MESINNISFFEFKSKLLEQQQKLLEEKIRNEWQDVRRSIRHPFENGSFLPKETKNRSGWKWMRKIISIAYSLGFFVQEMGKDEHK